MKGLWASQPPLCAGLTAGSCWFCFPAATLTVTASSVTASWSGCPSGWWRRICSPLWWPPVPILSHWKARAFLPSSQRVLCVVSLACAFWGCMKGRSHLGNIFFEYQHVIMRGFLFCFVIQWDQRKPEPAFKKFVIGYNLFPTKTTQCIACIQSIPYRAPWVLNQKGLKPVPLPDEAAQTLPQSSQFDSIKTAAVIFFLLQCSELFCGFVFFTHLFSLLETTKSWKNKTKRRITPSQLLLQGQ